MNLITEANCFLGPWEQKRNFSWSTIDNVNVNCYTSFQTNINCKYFKPADIEPNDDYLPEPKIYTINSASSHTSKSSCSDNKEIESKPKTAYKSKRKSSLNIDTSVKVKTSKTPLKYKKSAPCSASISKINQIENKIDLQIDQLRFGQKYYHNNSEVWPPERQNALHDVQSLEAINQFKTLYGEISTSNYNPSTLYRLKKMQTYHKRNINTNLIATLNTNTDSDKIFDKGQEKKCTCCKKLEPKSDFVRNQMTKSSSSSCSEPELDVSNLSNADKMNGMRSYGAKQPPTKIVQRIKSVQLIRNKNVELINTNNQLNRASISQQTEQSIQPILKVHKYNSNSQNILSLKQYSGASMIKKVTRSNSHQLIENEAKIHQNRNIINRNNVEIDMTTDFDNSFNSTHTRMMNSGSPCINNMKNSMLLRKLSMGSSHSKLQSSQSKYPEAISINGTNFLGTDGNLNFSNKQTLNKRVDIPSRRITSAESEIRDIQVKFNQLSKIGVK